MSDSTPWTEHDIPDQTDRVALITGANSGIGFEAARALAEHGAQVVLGCRDPRRAADAEQRLKALSPSGMVEVLALDLGDLTSVSAASTEFAQRHERLDLLINNAGLMATPKGVTAQGFETQIGVNHFGHFALTGELLPSLLATSESRVVTISSQGHRPGRINFADINSERRYSPWRAYCQSKLANLLFTFELQRRLAAATAPTIAVAAHPGTSNTNLGHQNSGGIYTVVSWALPLFQGLAQSSAMGALPTLRAATDPATNGGDYYGPHGFMEQRGHPVKVGASKRAHDVAVAARLWDASVAATGVDYAALRS